MSYDLQVWSALPIHRDAFCEPESWEQGPSCWTHARRNWQIVVSASDRVQPEDVPEEVSRLLPGIEWLTNLNVEGRATAEAFRLAKSTANHIAQAGHGVVLDQQEGLVWLPSGVKRLMLPRDKDVFDVVSISWWFLHSPLLTCEGREGLVNLLERILPEALPKRYGLYEPPQHDYAQTGKSQFLEFLGTNLHDTVVWYPRRPVTWVNMGFPNRLGANRLGFRVNHLSIGVEKNALFQPGWANNLKLFWQGASALIRPFYGDVRILGGYQWRGGTVSAAVRRGHAQHPVVGWWWTGIPQDLGSAAVLGEVYQRVWPSFVSAATMIDGLAFAWMDDWSEGSRLTEKVGGAPVEQMQKHPGFVARRQEYPLGWPFGEPFAS